jgi:PD-(D/E)XK nuclease superfamily protein
MQVNSCSFSSDKKLARCEQQFSYRYEEGLNLKTKKVGLFRGALIHDFLKVKYTGGDWKKAFRVWRQKVWVKLFDEEKEEYGFDFPETVKDLMEHYCEHWETWDGAWEILHAEQKFELKTKYGFPVRWICDLIVRDTDGSVVLVETKAKKHIPESDERILQPQVHGYAFLCSQIGIEIDKILWNYLRTEPVPRPKINKDGSLSKRQINTDQRGYLLSLQEAGIHPQDEEEQVALQKHLDSLPVTLALDRISNSVNLGMGQKFVRDWVERHRRAQHIRRPLRNWVSGPMGCKTSCDYYQLCQADMRGDVDRDLIIKRLYTIKHQEGELK